MVSDYERQRLLNIQRNKALLTSMGLDKPFFEPEEVKRQKPSKSAPKKRKAEEHDGAPDAKKATRVESVKSTDSGEASPLRRSSRNAGKTVDYKSEKQTGSHLPISFKSGIREMENSGPLGREAGSKRIHNPKTYGSIPGIEVGTWWETREACSADAIHAPWVGGIAVGPQGAYSVALSGGYPGGARFRSDDIDFLKVLSLSDDVDWGYAFTYTGSGGRDLKGTKANPLNLRTAPQSSDQTFENNFNKALKISAETKKPVRVIRGFKVDSPYAPYEGYRYDGLYRVEKANFLHSIAWQEQGMDGFLICKFAFKRLPEQPPLPRRAAIDESEDHAADKDDGANEAAQNEASDEE
ncbi:E3 ubiquitin-protein ligase ORTHRUS 5 [Mycena sanguinolenta]|uniref:E3 ubiquitin-protein ligase ORTHRUS 5 n=1 Tax=Mycena sanguinolenta TaxID=230812 RepID=A0A8H6XE54_9AGAR|nr:E3 ubiquitin-protein ligase ORTHRUS 5 [Mycena sanguinolenta]